MVEAVSGLSYKRIEEGKRLRRLDSDAGQGIQTVAIPESARARPR
jgi:hypothetical protein